MRASSREGQAVGANVDPAPGMADPHWGTRAAITGESNVVAYGLCRPIGELYQYLNKRVGTLSGVKSVETVLIARELKQLAKAGPR